MRVKSIIVMYLAVWTSCIAIFWAGSRTDAWLRIYWATVFCVVLPVAASVLSMLLGAQSATHYGRCTLICLCFGGAYLGAQELTFGSASAARLIEPVSISYWSALWGALFSLTGFAAAYVSQKRRRRGVQ